MTYEVSAAAKPPQTTPLYIGIHVHTREGNGEYCRGRAVMPLPRFVSNLSHFDGLNVRISPRRAGGDTRRSLPACRHGCVYKRGSSAAVLPPPTLRPSLFACHSRRFTTQNSLFHSTGDPSHWRKARRVILVVISVLELKTKEVLDSYSGIGLSRIDQDLPLPWQYLR
jgi:hypothetical protein